MDKKEQFKTFVKKNPSLINFVNNNEMTWQKFYEMFDMYGESNEVWDKYIKVVAATTAATTFGLTDVLGFLKNMNLDSVQEGLNSVQRVIGVFGEMGKKEEKKEEYKPRPIYKQFED